MITNVPESFDSGSLPNQYGWRGHVERVDVPEIQRFARPNIHCTSVKAVYAESGVNAAAQPESTVSVFIHVAQFVQHQEWRSRNWVVPGLNGSQDFNSFGGNARQPFRAVGVPVASFSVSGNLVSLQSQVRSRVNARPQTSLSSADRMLWMQSPAIALSRIGGM